MALRALHTYYHLRAFAATSLRVATCNASPEAFVTFRTSRPFHTSFLTLAEDNKGSETVAAAVADVKSDTTLEASDAATEPPKTSRRRRRFMEWMNGEGAKFKKPAMGTTNYLAGRTPFPMNPLFSPNPPVTDSLREQIYENYMYDSALPTPRMLGAKFKLSIRRIEAILRLKAHEKALVEQGFKPQKSFTKGMEQLLRTRESVLTEPLKNVSPRVGKPMFMVVEEDAEFLPDDAARVLRRLTVGEQQELAKMAEQKHQFVLEGHAESDEKPRVVSPVKREGNRRFKFLITDKGRKEEGEEGGKRFLIRDQDGTLRVATKMEIGKRLLKHH